MTDQTPTELSLVEAVLEGREGEVREILGEIESGRRQGCDQELVDALYVAVKEGNLPLVTTLLEAGADPSDTDSYGDLPIRLAIQQKNFTIANVILDAGCEPKKGTFLGETALSEAIKLEATSSARSYSRSKYRRTIEGACGVRLSTPHNVHTQCLQLIKRILQQGASPHVYVNKNNYMYLENFDRHAPLELIQSLVDHGGLSGKNGCGESVLQRALATNRADILDYLIHKGVNPAATLPMSIIPPILRMKELNYEMLQVFMKAGVDITVSYNGYSVIDLLARENHRCYEHMDGLLMLQELLYAGCQVTGSGKGSSPLATVAKERATTNSTNPKLWYVRMFNVLHQENVAMENLTYRWPDHDPLAKALLCNNKDAVQNLIEADWDLNLMFNLTKFTLGVHRDALLRNKDLVEFVTICARQPKGLRAICRRRIRRCLPQGLSRHTDQLPLPDLLRTFLGFPELDHWIETLQVFTEGEHLWKNNFYNQRVILYSIPECSA